ncbi:IS5 family transposase [Halomonas cerina]|uniref:Transposase n=1 Tax=Halomonas cerina TaxID=447424 RepID=A0A839VIV3_9GAMM|nr:IS5 family transposase [Halomonas cerina]MBB3192514.1 transposase [Halomonas cerina]
MAKRGPPSKIQERELAVIREIITEKPESSLGELRDELARRTGVNIHEDHLSKQMKYHGFKRIRGPSTTEDSPPRTEEPSPYGYTDQHRHQAPEQQYPSCLTDAEWGLVSDIFETEGGRGVPPRYPRRLLVDACCYVVRSGCSWRMLPKEFPPWQNVYRTFRRWSAEGKFEKMHDRLRTQWREREGRNAEPTAAVLDAQSTRHSPQGGESGYDAGKKVKGRKRHVLVDTLGLVLAVSVTAACIQDPHGAHPVMASAVEKYPSISKVFVDSAYAGQCAQTINQQHGVSVDIIRRPRSGKVGSWCPPEQEDLFTQPTNMHGFVVQPKRWVVERTFSWIEKSRRLIMHHDRLTDVSEAWVWLASGRQLLKRLTSTT